MVDATDMVGRAPDRGEGFEQKTETCCGLECPFSHLYVASLPHYRYLEDDFAYTFPEMEQKLQTNRCRQALILSAHSQTFKRRNEDHGEGF